MRKRLLELSFVLSLFVALIGAAAVDNDPVKGMVMFGCGVAYCVLFAYQNGGM